jgi:glycosyltransferase involved in cell wall biosynthesis
MNVLIVAPLPPPVSGNSLPVVALCERLGVDHTVDVVNLSRRDHGSGTASLSRVREVLSAIALVRRLHRSADVVYLTLAESLLGNLRDVLLLAVLGRRRDSVVVHMFGGNTLTSLLQRKSNPRSRITRRLLTGIGGIICEGGIQASVFRRACPGTRVHEVANFASDELFVSDREFEQKFADPAGPRRLLFLSNLLPGKGQRELLAAFSELRSEVPFEVGLDVAGALSDDADGFGQLLRTAQGVSYHGQVGPDKRRELFVSAHVFCLPTYYPYEGQPFSIVESYAAGCAVITCLHSGIPDIFVDGINGLAVEQRDVLSLKAALRKLVEDTQCMASFGASNREMAKDRYTRQRFQEQVHTILVEAGRKP